MGASNDLGRELTQSNSLLTLTFSLQIHYDNIMNSTVVLFASTVIVVAVVYIFISRFKKDKNRFDEFDILHHNFMHKCAMALMFFFKRSRTKGKPVNT